MFTEIDRQMMAEALRLAEQGLYTTHPNPRVGCVLAHGAEVVGRGFHVFAGGAHAEIGALAEAGARARGATAYVTLEPCCHTGRTGPCSSALIAASVRKVVFAHEDPNPVVAGNGARQLRKAGIEVIDGLMREESRALNPGYLKRIECGRPFIRSKIAASLDGRTALKSGESKWITGEAARADVQIYRGRSSAILTGIDTVIDDDPRLNFRLVAAGVQSGQAAPQPCPQPARVILDSDLRLPKDAKLLKTGGPVHVLTAGHASEFGQTTVHRVERSQDGLDLAGVVDVLTALEFNEVLVEAGARLNGSLFKAGLIDELVVYMAPHMLGEDARGMANIGVLTHMSSRLEFTIKEFGMLGKDLKLVLRPTETGDSKSGGH